MIRLRLLSLRIVTEWRYEWRTRIWTMLALLFCIFSLVLPWYLSKHGHHPPVGTYIAFMAAIAASVALRKEPPVSEKAAWILLVMLLMVAEVRNLFVIDREQAETFHAIQHRFDETEQKLGQTANGLDLTEKSLRKLSDDTAQAEKSNQQQFAAQIDKSNKLMSMSKEGLDEITGGDSYTYVIAGLTSAPPFQLMVNVRGKHSVHNVTAEFQQYFGRDSDSVRKQLQSMHGLPTGSGSFLPGITPINESVGQGRYFIRVLTQNSDINEQLDIQRCADGGWSEAIHMNGPGAKENNTWRGTPGCHSPFQ